MNTLTNTTPEPALPPQVRRPDEPLEAHALFLRWWSECPRPVIENVEVMQLANRFDWRRRAELLDHRIAPTRPLPDVVRGVALDALQVLSIELEALAAQCRAQPGSQRLKDLTPLLTLLASCQEWAIKDTDQGDSGKLDLSLATVEEKAILFRALPILERIRRAKKSA